MISERVETKILNRKTMTQDEFIDKWLVGYESREQKEEFAIEMMADLASLQSKGKTKEEIWKITAENKLPICYKTGEWDGKQSDLCLCVDTEGKHHLATCYESNREFEWYDKDDFGLRHDVVKWAYVETLEEYAQSHANKDGWYDLSDIEPDMTNLHKEGNQYLVLIDGKVNIAYWGFVNGYGGGFCPSESFELKELLSPTHWMPLPKSPL